MQKAILLVSFGTAVKETRIKTLDAIESDIRTAFPDIPVSHAWTSSMLRTKVHETEALIIPDISEAMRKLHQSGVKELILQPTFISAGKEYRQMIEAADSCATLFDSIQFGSPLLSEDSWNKDITEPIISAIMSEFPPLTDRELLVFMGHGTADGEDRAYQLLDELIRSRGYRNVFLKTMKSSSAIDEIIQYANQNQISKITLAPFMIVAGGHALKDMAGAHESSWKSRLETAGFTVNCLQKGLGEYTGIRQILIDRIADNF